MMVVELSYAKDFFSDRPIFVKYALTLLMSTLYQQIVHLQYSRSFQSAKPTLDSFTQFNISNFDHCNSIVHVFIDLLCNHFPFILFVESLTLI